MPCSQGKEWFYVKEFFRSLGSALIAVIGSEKIYALGYLYAIFPAGTGAVVMLIVAFWVNNIPNLKDTLNFG